MVLGPEPAHQRGRSNSLNDFEMCEIYCYSWFIIWTKSEVKYYIVCECRGTETYCINCIYFFQRHRLRLFNFCFLNGWFINGECFTSSRQEKGNDLKVLLFMGYYAIVLPVHLWSSWAEYCLWSKMFHTPENKKTNKQYT